VAQRVLARGKARGSTARSNQKDGESLHARSDWIIRVIIPAFLTPTLQIHRRVAGHGMQLLYALRWRL
jgi:hypothetical protein